MSYGLYIHIPYCPAKCRYCDFYSQGGHTAVPDAYLAALLRAWALFPARQPDTVYLGGGTPGLLSPAQVESLLQALQPVPGAEVTLEANPECVTPTALAGWRAAGVNRISFGVQTAREDSLRRLGRHHTTAQSQQALAWARQAGFANICGDIMLALPGYSRAEFDETLALLDEGGCTHISAYLLKIEPRTAFGKHPPAGLPSEDEAAVFYLYAVEQLEKAGFAQYEISNFARPGFAGRHNLIYWNCGDYLGLGPAAYSCLAGQRFHWPADTNAFMAEPALSQLVQDGVCDAEDFIMLQTRLAAGLCCAELEERYGLRFTAAQQAFLAHCQAAGLACWDGKTLCLTPQGLLVQNSILAELLA